MIQVISERPENSVLISVPFVAYLRNARDPWKNHNFLFFLSCIYSASFQFYQTWTLYTVSKLHPDEEKLFLWSMGHLTPVSEAQTRFLSHIYRHIFWFIFTLSRTNYSSFLFHHEYTLIYIYITERELVIEEARTPGSFIFGQRFFKGQTNLSLSRYWYKKIVSFLLPQQLLEEWQPR